MTHPRYWDALAVAIALVAFYVITQLVVVSIRTRPGRPVPREPDRAGRRRIHREAAPRKHQSPPD